MALWHRYFFRDLWRCWLWPVFVSFFHFSLLICSAFVVIVVFQTFFLWYITILIGMPFKICLNHLHILIQFYQFMPHYMIVKAKSHTSCLVTETLTPWEPMSEFGMLAYSKLQTLRPCWRLCMCCLSMMKTLPLDPSIAIISSVFRIMSWIFMLFL